MKDKVEVEALQTIRTYNMVQQGEKILVALSGGADSLCLLSVLVALSDELSIEVEALYVDHALRPESSAEALQVKKLCSERFGVTCSVRRVSVLEHAKAAHVSVQEAARELRYQALGEVAAERGAHRIAVGHTADDQAETVLMRLLRGAGGNGLSGIPPVRDSVIRPLLSLWRSEIESYCQRHALPYIEDASNRSEKYLRNRIRHHLIPLIEGEYNPKFRQALCRMAEVTRADEEYLSAYVAELYNSAPLAGSDGPGWARIRAQALRELPLALARRVLRYAYGKATGRMAPPFERLEAALRLCEAGARGGSEIELGANISALRQGQWIEIRVKRQKELCEQ